MKAKVCKKSLWLYECVFQYWPSDWEHPLSSSLYISTDDTTDTNATVHSINKTNEANGVCHSVWDDDVYQVFHQLYSNAFDIHRSCFHVSSIKCLGKVVEVEEKDIVV